MSTAKLLSPDDVWKNRIYSGGWRESGFGIAAVTEKATGAALATIGVGSATDITTAAAAASKAQKAWAALSGPQRGDVLREASRLLLLHADEVAEQLVRETGSIRLKADWEVHITAREFLEAAALASLPVGIVTATLEPGVQSIARRIPLGVIGIITPWNSPLILGVRALAPALALGNAVVLKPDVQTPVIGGVIFARLLERAGLPEGVFHMLPGAAETGAALVRDPEIDMVSFTGSTRVGRDVGATASGLLKRVSLELGGNNPYIVLEDADVEAAASAGAWGSFFHQGQICLTAGRHIVHESLAKAYAEALARRAEALVVGDPMDPRVQVGPIVNERQAANAQRILTESVAKGARIIAGGARDGLFFRPTVLIGVTAEMPAFSEEIFGPIAPIITFRTDDEAAAIANATDYGLSSAVVSPNLDRARKIADQIRAGVVHINDQTVVHGVYGPIGGLGVSGNGFGHSTLTNPDQFTEWQWITTRSQLPHYPF